MGYAKGHNRCFCVRCMEMLLEFRNDRIKFQIFYYYQMGRGRTATGTVIACLVKLRCDFGQPVRLPSIPRVASNVDMESSSGDEAGNEMETYNSTSAILYQVLLWTIYH